MTEILTTVFDFVLTLIMTLVQVVCYPINLLFNGLFPDLTNYIEMIDNGLTYAFDGLSWALHIIPPSVRGVLLFIFTIELSLLGVMRTSHLTSKAWKLLQKIKFW